MNRYEQEESKRYLPSIMILIIVVVLSGTFIWQYQKSPQQTVQKHQLIEIPEAQLKSEAGIDLEKEDDGGLVDISELDKVGSEKEHLNEVLNVKPELLALKGSDAFFRQALNDVSKNLSAWFKVDDVITRYLVIINDVAQSQILYKHRDFLKMPQKIAVKEDSNGLYLAREGYIRYNGLANAIASIDVQNGVRLYRTFKPLFEEVYKDFGYPAEYKVDDIFMKAAATVIESPVINHRIALVRHSVRYKFADEKLESLTDVEKQMLRMGPRNTRIIQAKLRQLVEALLVLNEE